MSDELRALSRRTLSHYERSADDFWAGTRTHDVSQNYAALLSAIEGAPPFRILDLGCGPGRDLAWFRDAGHDVVGIDGSARFVAMAAAHAGVPVLHQDMLELSLGDRRFDGVFANASLFHVPTVALPSVLAELHRALVPRGVLFASNPRGSDQEGWNGDRYACYRELDGWRALVEPAGFDLVSHFYRPEGRPCAEQPWLATVFRRRAMEADPLRSRVARATKPRDVDARVARGSFAGSRGSRAGGGRSRRAGKRPGGDGVAQGRRLRAGRAGGAGADGSRDAPPRRRGGAQDPVGGRGSHHRDLGGGGLVGAHLGDRAAVVRVVSTGDDCACRHACGQRRGARARPAAGVARVSSADRSQRDLGDGVRVAV